MTHEEDLAITKKYLDGIKDWNPTARELAISRAFKHLQDTNCDLTCTVAEVRKDRNEIQRMLVDANAKLRVNAWELNAAKRETVDVRQELGKARTELADFKVAYEQTLQAHYQKDEMIADLRLEAVDLRAQAKEIAQQNGVLANIKDVSLSNTELSLEVVKRQLHIDEDPNSALSFVAAVVAREIAERKRASELAHELNETKKLLNEMTTRLEKAEHELRQIVDMSLRNVRSSYVEACERFGTNKSGCGHALNCVAAAVDREITAREKFEAELKAHAETKRLLEKEPAKRPSINREIQMDQLRQAISCMNAYHGNGNLVASAVNLLAKIVLGDS